MNFYRYFYILTSFILLFIEAKEVGDINIMESGLDTVSPFSIGLQFFVKVNNTSNNDVEAELSPDKCCLKMEPNLDCNILVAIGSCVQIIPKGTTKTFKVVAPLLDPFERYGYCIFNFDSVHDNIKRSIKRTPVKITFDTRLKNRTQFIEIPESIKLCQKIDEDPLNNCEPVDCDTYYNGKKSYFNKRFRRCTHIPKCISDSKNNIRSVIYNPNSNKCVKEKAITKGDIEFLKEFYKSKSRKTKDIFIINNSYTTTEAITHIPDKNNKDIIVEELLPDEGTKEASKTRSGVINKVSYFKYLSNKYLITNKFTLIVFGVIILIQCCLICTMVYFLPKSCYSCKKKKIISKFYNYRQDASVTTPLIETSNIDTDTAEFQYLSESSNIDKKIKCYKACQKEWKNNVKMSISDDILSKCLTRRDWNRQPAKSNAIPEINETVVSNYKEVYPVSKYRADMVNLQQKEVTSNTSKKSDIKVNFENEIKLKTNDKDSKKIIRKAENKVGYNSKQKIEDKDYLEPQCDTSEKEIKCHSYNYMNETTNKTSFQPSTYSNNQKIYKVDKSKKETLSVSTEKGAQAEFSNDSIDDFLSERGMMFLTGENLSKYTSSSGSNMKKSSTSSDISSKTSKNNILKNVLSLFHRKSKHCTSSDPGKKKSSQNFNIKILHDMSHVSIYSSSNSESDYIKNLKKTKDSRSSL